MTLQANNVRVPLDALLPQNEDQLKRLVAKALGVKPGQLGAYRILRKSVDARKKTNVHFVLAVEGATKGEVLPPARAKGNTPPSPVISPVASVHRPLVVGAGPAGLFCALRLARAGLQPLLIERGKPAEERIQDVQAFAQGGALNVQSNIQFGEGGAGTFSDGKLTTGTKSPFARYVLEEFVACGAPEDILVDAKPHIGTDYLPQVVKNLRRQIEEAGGEVRFSTQLVGQRSTAEDTVIATLRDLITGEEEEVETDALVLAIGHSARDTFTQLNAEGLAMERKPFAVGVRIEHPQQAIDQAQYGPAAGHPALPPASYQLAVHDQDGRGVYTFCMCPGGEVVAAASEEGGVCTNGMSNHARDGAFANSALLVEVHPEDLPEEEGVLAGMAFQRQLEQAAYRAGGETYAAPAQRVGDFLGDDGCPLAHHSSVAPTYPRGVVEADLHEVLPPFVTEALEEALPQLGRKLKGFNSPDTIMTAVEARSSSPVRLVRDKASLRSVSHPVIFPTGEGAGYAGGIMSAACDGLRVAEAILGSGHCLSVGACSSC